MSVCLAGALSTAPEKFNIILNQALEHKVFA